MLGKKALITGITGHPQYYRPTEVDLLCGDPSKAKRLLGWNPKKTPFKTLIEKMVFSDVGLIKSGIIP